jgi:hypothetical protein
MGIRGSDNAIRACCQRTVVAWPTVALLQNGGPKIQFAGSGTIARSEAKVRGFPSPASRGQ